MKIQPEIPDNAGKTVVFDAVIADRYSFRSNSDAMNNVVFGSVIASIYSLGCFLVVFNGVITCRYSIRYLSQLAGCCIVCYFTIIYSYSWFLFLLLLYATRDTTISTILNL